MWKDSETKIDFLDFKYLTETVTDIINDKNLSPSSIGVYGNWGSGKSSLMQMCIEGLSKEKNTLCIKFNGWLFEGYEDAKTAFLGTILDKINKKKSPTGKAKEILKRLYKNTDKLKLASMGLKYGIDFLTTGGIGTIADITVKSILSKIKDKPRNVSEKDIDNILKKEFKSEELRKNMIRSLKFIFILLVPAILGIFLFGRYVLLLFGEEYAKNSFQVLLILSLTSVPYAVNAVYAAVKKVQLKVMHVIHVYAVVAVITIVGGYLLMQSMGLVGVGYAWLIGNGCVACWVVIKIIRRV